MLPNFQVSYTIHREYNQVEISLGRNILLINLRTFLRIRQQRGVSADGGNLLIILHIFLIFQ